MKQWHVGIFLFNEVEVLDFAGPFEVFSISTIPDQQEKPFIVKTVSEQGELIKARNGLMVQPDFSFSTAPDFNILIIPGGYGAEEIELYNETVLRWLKEQRTKSDLVASVCTGAFLLAQAGLLEGKKATTHWIDIDRLENEFPNLDGQRNTKYVDEGSIITAGGISAGINMSFHIVNKLLGTEIAQATAKRMEYDIVL